MEEEIGKTAGAMWQAPVFDWAIGWLACEDQIVIPTEKRSFRIRTQRRRALY